MDTLFRDATVLTMNDAHEIMEHGDVLVRDGCIAAVTTDEAMPAVDAARPDVAVVDCHGDVLMPGLINAHAHISMSLFRNYANDQNLQTWLEESIWPLESHLTREDIVCGARLSMAEMLAGGITTFMDMYDEEAAIAEVVEAVGMRAVLGEGVTDRSLQRKLPLIQEMIETSTPRVRYMVAPHAVYTCSPETLRTLGDLAASAHVGIHIHLAETQQEDAECRAHYGLSPTALLHREGLLNGQSLLAHGVFLDDEDIETIARAGASVVYNPASNMKLASGFMRLSALRDAGVNVALGTDGPSSNNTQDLFKDMRLGSFIQKGRSGDATAAPARAMLELATRGGARAMGRDDLGQIAPGARADLVLVDFHNIRHTPFPDDVEAALVYATAADDVRLTMVEGEILYRDGAFSHLDDDAVRHEAQAAWQRLCAFR